MSAKESTPMPEGVTRENRPKPPPAPPKVKPTCHWSCTGCDICGSKGHGNSWF